MSHEFIFQIWRRYHDKFDFPKTIYTPPPPTPMFEEKYLFNKYIEEFYKLLIIIYLIIIINMLVYTLFDFCSLFRKLC